MAILSNFNKALNQGEPIVGSGSSAIGSTVFVMNTDAKTPTTAWDDPYYQVGGAPGEEDNIRPIVVPGMGYWLELNVAWSGNSPAANTPVVAVYGEVPKFDYEDARYWPCDINSTIVGSSDNGTTAVTDTMWIPLVDRDSYQNETNHSQIDGTNLVSLLPDQVVALDSGNGTPGSDPMIKMGVPRYVYLSGCTRVICTIQAEAANATAAVIVGRLVG